MAKTHGTAGQGASNHRIEKIFASKLAKLQDKNAKNPGRKRK